MLEDRKNAYDRCGTGVNYNQQAEQLKYLNLGIYSQVAQDVLRRLDKAFQNFFRRVKNGDKKAGYPRFRGKNRYDSFTYPQSGFKILENGRLNLSKIGNIRIFLHREIEGKIKTCTIKRDGDQW
jgi:putative transposase